jgi:hypothetical protein
MGQMKTRWKILAAVGVVVALLGVAYVLLMAIISIGMGS